MTNKKWLTALVGSVIILTMALVVIGSNKRKNDSSAITPPSSPILFYGNTCPHCADVDKWMDKNEISKKIIVVRKEVYDNQENARELSRAAVACGIPTNDISVPLLYAEEKCMAGTPDVILYLSEKAGIK